MTSLHNMTLKEKIGQLFMFGFVGTDVTEDVAEMLEHEKIGSVCLFPRNIETPAQVKKLNQALQKTADRSGHSVPLIISADQENGIVRRLKTGVTALPGSMLLGAIDEADATEQVSHATAKELRALGVNMNLAPVVDVNNNPANPVIGVRSFGERAKHVAKHGRAFIEGHRDAGVMTCPKHFPGHGDTSVDSHKALPENKRSLPELEGVELVPFSRLIESDTADAVMTGHIHFSELDTEPVPSSLSKNVTTHLLREKMGYQGVIITDSLEMNAIQDSIGMVEGVVQAFKAGADILLVAHTRSLQAQAVERMEDAVKKGEIPEADIDRSVSRILRLKEAYINNDPAYDEENVPSFVGGADHQTLARAQYDRGVTCVQGGGMLPLEVSPESAVLAITVRMEMQAEIEEKQRREKGLADAIADYHTHVYDWTISPTEMDIGAICETAQHAGAVVVGTDNAYGFPSQVQLIEKLAENDVPLIVIALRGPYDLACLPEVEAMIATYEPSYPAIESAVGTLFGAIEPEGRLPVTLPDFG